MKSCRICREPGVQPFLNPFGTFLLCEGHASNVEEAVPCEPWDAPGYDNGRAVAPFAAAPLPEWFRISARYGPFNDLDPG